ncbi:MAG: GAF domain-containing protein [Thermodesulfobacteriota bacterium]
MLNRIIKSLTLKWMIFSIFLVTIPLAVAGFNIIKIYQRDLKKSVIAAEEMKAGMVVQKTEAFFEKISSSLLTLTKDEEFNRNGFSSHIKDHLETLLNQNDCFWEMAVLDEKGNERIRVSKYKVVGPHDLKNQAKSEMFGVASKGKIYYGKFYLTEDIVPTITIAVPIGEPEEKQLGVLSAKIHLRYLWNLIPQTQIGKHGDTYVVDQEGNLIAHPDTRRVLLKTNVRHLPMVSEVISGKEGNLEFQYPKAEKVLCVYKPVKNLGWGVIVQLPVSEAYGPLKHVARTALMWILIGLGIAVILSLILTRKLTLPIKQLSDEMVETAKGNLDTYIRPSSKDELGLLTESFNRMIRDLRQSREALKETEERYRRIFENSKDMLFITSVDGKFVDVNQAGVEILGYENKERLLGSKSTDTYFDPEERRRFQSEINQEGFVKDFEVKLKRLDGTPIDTLITASGRRDKEGQIIGYEGIIKDISTRKRMEEGLVQRTKELEALYDLSVLINQTLDLDRVLLDALDRASNLTGFEMGGIYLFKESNQTLELKYSKGHSDAFIENVKVLNPGEGISGKAFKLKQPILPSIEEYASLSTLSYLKKEGIKTLLGVPLLAKGKAVGALTLSSRSARQLDQKEINLLESIGSQIGLALENAILFSAVAKAKSEWETTFDSVTDLITIRYKDYRIMRGNKAAFRRYGLKPDQIIGKKCFEVLHQKDQPCEGCFVAKTLLTKKPASGERESQYLKGIFQYYTFPIYDLDREVVAVVVLAREITEEKQRETEHDVVNNINKILASSLDVRDLIKAVKAELKRVIPAERITITLLDEQEKGLRYFALEKDDEAGELMGGVLSKKGTSFENAVETGHPVIIPDTDKSDSWLDQKLLKEGIRSSLVFPLEYKGKVIGTMNFGSREINHFSDHHINFLGTIALGLAISIQNALLFEETKKRLDELTILYEIMKISASSLNLDKMLREIMSSLNNFFRFEALGILLVDEATRNLIPHPESYNELSMKNIGKLGLRVGKGLTGWVAERGEPLLVNDVREDERYVCGDENVRSEMCVPLKVGQKVIAVLDVQSTALNAFSEDDRRLLSIIGGQVATIIDNLHLYEEIKQSEEKYRTVVEGVREGVAVLGTDFKFKYVNNRLSEIFGYGKEELTGMDFRNVLTEESRQPVVDRYGKWVRKEEDTPHFEFTILRKDGEIRSMEMSNKEMRDYQGNLSFVALLRDITEKKMMEEHLFQAEKLRALAEMASGVAHDFNNALAAILGNTQLLLYTVQEEELKETLRTIEKVTRDSAQTVRRLQDFTRKRVHQELYIVDMNTIVRDSIEITKPKWKDEAQSKGIRIEVVSNLGEISSVVGSGSELREMLTNMIFNAIEAMPEGGKIAIRTFEKKKNVCVTISDTGIGISEEVKKKIFEPFFTTKPFTNTGLGLSMSYGIVKRFGGDVEVESKVGHGTTFTILLPIGGEGKKEVILPPMIKEGKKAHILVIDDEDFVRNVLSRTLIQASHRVTLAEDGDKGIRLFKNGKFDMVLTDLGMPGMSGWEVCRMIKTINPHTPVGMITGWGAEMSRSKMKEYGLDFFISKPFDLHQILNAVTQALESKKEGFLS